MSEGKPSEAALADFLRASRARVKPDDVGLPADGRQRRVTGLRREEVAQLANISVDYLVRLEQGRTTTASRAVLNALADALGLRPDERDYLLAIADTTAAPAPSQERQQVTPQTQLLLDTLHEMPAFVYGRRQDVLAWNPAAAALFTDYAALPEPQRNLAWLTFLAPAYRDFYADWPRIAQECVGALRIEAHHHPNDAQLAALVDELSAKDNDFRTWWADHRVGASVRRKTYQHPIAGPLSLDAQQLTVQSRPDQYLVAYSATPGSPSENALRFLIHWATSQSS